ncbi:uncharacterized protein METZ01_LOCUS198886 [marine metagenome]|uniref:Uncharacterized protein n=1 Tax=marine metagenome TaxID=408172 RepID=A0A382E6R9_9ZZZZ
MHLDSDWRADTEVEFILQLVGRKVY